MPLFEAVFRAGLEALTTALPISASGHRMVAGLWLGASPEANAAAAIGQVGWLVAVTFITRRRLAAALVEGARNFARPALLHASPAGRDAITLLLTASLATATGLLLWPLVSPLLHQPLPVAIGLLLTSAGLASTYWAPAPHWGGTGIVGGLAVALAVGLAVVPGLSTVAAAFVVLRWLGQRGWEAAELALLVAIPGVVLRTATTLLGTAGLAWPNAASLLLAGAAAVATASLGVVAWRLLCRKQRTAVVTLWLVPVAFALLAYDRALPPGASSLPPPEASSLLSVSGAASLPQPEAIRPTAHAAKTVVLTGPIMFQAARQPTRYQ